MLTYLALESLPNDFKQIKSNYVTQKESWTLDELIAVSMQEKHNIKEKKTINVIQATDENSSKKEKSIGIKKLKCYFCKMTGHMKKECRKYKRCLEQKQARGNDISICLESTLVDIFSDSWWLDSGATVHVSNSLQGFTTKRVPTKDEIKVYVGNGIQVKVEFIGDIKIRLESGFILDLIDVVYVPAMTRNLIYVSRLAKAKFELVVNDFGFSILRNKILVRNGTLVNGMYQLTIQASDHIMNIASTSKIQNKTESSQLWHKRLCHISKERTKSLCKEHVLPPLNLTELNEVCINCVKGKLTNTSKKEAIKSTSLLELIHTDICGPFPTPTHDGFKNFITFTYEFLRFGYVYMIT